MKSRLKSSQSTTKLGENVPAPEATSSSSYFHVLTLFMFNLKGLNNFTTIASSMNITTNTSDIDYTDVWKPRMREVS